MKSKIFYLLVFFSFQTFSQSEGEKVTFSADSIRFFVKNIDRLQIIFDQSVLKIGPKQQKSIEPIQIDDKDLEADLNYLDFDVVYDSIGVPVFVRGNLGEVFTFTNNEFKRVDLSDNLKSNSGSIKIRKGPYVFSFFGYGLFNYSNLALVFDFTSREWNRINFSSSYIPVERTKPFFHQMENEIIFLSGEKNNLKQTDIFSFNLNTFTYEFLATLADDFPFPNINSFNGSIHIDNRFSLFDLGQLVLIDFKNLAFSISNGFVLSEINFPFVCMDDKIYYINSKNGYEFIDVISKKNLLGLFTDFKSLRRTSVWIHYFQKGFFILFFSAISLFLMVRVRDIRRLKRHYILKQSNYITYKNTLLILDVQESQIIDFLIDQPKSKVTHLYSLSCFEEYSDSYKKVYIPKAVDDLIEKIDSAFKDHDKKISIKKGKNKLDKRITEVRLKGDIIRYEGWVRYLFKF